MYVAIFDFTVEPGKAKNLPSKFKHHISAFSKTLADDIKIVLDPSCLSFLLKATPLHFCLKVATFENHLMHHYNLKPFHHISQL